MRQRDRGDGRPRCYSAEPMREYRAHAGYDDEGRLRTVMIPWAFSRECKSWAGNPGSDPVPLIENWACIGCRHYPATLVADALEAQEARA